MKIKNKWVRLLEWIEKKPAAFWCVAFFSFLWLAAVVPFLSLHNDGVRPIFSPVNKGNQDFAQYYMGGAIVQERAFDSMYPNVREDICSNAGWPQSSDPKPAYAAIAAERGVENSFRYMLPPPSALLFAPLALLPYPLARGVWVVLLGVCCWGICFFSYRMSIRIGGSRATGLLWWGIWAFSPLMLKALRTANSTPVVALALAVAAWGVFRNGRVAAVVACIVAGLLKGTSLIFVPFILFMKRWGIVLGGIVTAVVLTLAMGLLAGTDVYREFFEVIYPTTRIPDPSIGNQSVFGFIYRCWGPAGLQFTVITIMKTCGYLIISIVFFRMWKKRESWKCDYSQFNSAVLAVLGLHLIFSAYCWDHYILFYLPFWTVLWNRCHKWPIRMMLLLSAALVWFPLIVVHNVKIAPCEPFQSHMLWGQILLVSVAIMDILKKEEALVKECP